LAGIWTGLSGVKMESMFDIYTIQQDGTPLLVESVECQAIARETAYHLSMLFPGESFVYFDRADERGDCFAWKLAGCRDTQTPLPC
jgi:hypothetical protein